MLRRCPLCPSRRTERHNAGGRISRTTKPLGHLVGLVLGFVTNTASVSKKRVSDLGRRTSTQLDGLLEQETHGHHINQVGGTNDFPLSAPGKSGQTTQEGEDGFSFVQWKDLRKVEGKGLAGDDATFCPAEEMAYPCSQELSKIIKTQTTSLQVARPQGGYCVEKQSAPSKVSPTLPEDSHEGGINAGQRIR